MAEFSHVAVVGAGTMGAGIAGACAAAGCDVALIDTQADIAAAAIERLQAGKRPAIDADAAARIRAVALDDLEDAIANADWVCEAIVERLEPKRDLFARVEAARPSGSVVSTNTSGIPLRDITAGMPTRLREDMAVTHFFNPVHVMKLLELVPGEETKPATIERLARFGTESLGKGPVYAKDTVNFIGNRIGCFWMLAGMHIGGEMQAQGLTPEIADAVMSAPVGLPPTGLYGLIDLIGLDIMDSVAKNLAANLPAGDLGEAYATLPATEQRMLAAGQLGRKSGSGFYRMIKQDDGSRLSETYLPATDGWRARDAVALDTDEQSLASLLFTDSIGGQFAWRAMGATLAYAADLVPDIADDIVNVDRAMRWGFNWAQGPFEMLDEIGPARFAERWAADGHAVPKRIEALRASGHERFYSEDGRQFVGVDGQMHDLPG